MTARPLGGLWARYLRARERERGGLSCPVQQRRVEREVRTLRDRLVVNYSPLARYVASRVLARSIGGVDREEVVSWGLCGLLGAVETYEPSRPAKFETYAISKIRWSILDELRKADPLPRSARMRVRRVEQVRSELTQRYGRAPTESELTVSLGVSLREHRAFVDRVERARISSLEAQAGSGAFECGLHDLVADGRAADPANAVEGAEVRELLRRAIEELGEQERIVTTFYYYEGLTLREIGGILHLTEGRISQILRSAMIRLRNSLPDTVCLPGGSLADP